ncbi:hypothetical protein [Klebsiella variicola]|uniref:hypothetical protein n=1 Tax=Klebsiella variicola TaxID=244366 RepID=UPI0039F62DE4
MSEITETHAAWVPPPFPPQGRLPGGPLQVGQNCHQQNSDEQRYHQAVPWLPDGAWSRRAARHCIQPVFRRYRQ